MLAKPRHTLPEMTADALSASGRTSEKLSLPTLQSKMKCDPEGYTTELDLIYSQFKSSLELFKQQAALNFTSISGVGADSTVSKDLGDRAMFLSHVTPFYPNQLLDFPKQLANFLRSSARSLPSSLRVHVTQALILMLNRKIVDIVETLGLFMELQILGDRVLRKLAFDHVIHSIRRMNQKHKNESKNRALQNVLFAMLQEEDEAKAKRSLMTLCDLHRRKVWFDDRTSNAICSACFHSSSRIMIAALSFLLDYEKIEDDNDSDCSSDEDESTTPQHQVVLSKQAVYKIKMMLLKVVARTVGLHRLILLNFYPFLQKYVQPHQRDVTNLLASAVQACHDMVPPDAVEPMFRQIVNQFVHDKSRTEAIAVGLNVVREICLRIPLLMTEDLLQDLVLYRKSHEKAVSSAARSLVTLFREVCPSLLIKKDRGRPTNPKARPKAFGEVTVSSDVPGVELLHDDDDDEDDDGGFGSSDDDHQAKEDDAIEEDASSEDDSSHYDGASEYNSTCGDDERDQQNLLSSDDDEVSEDENDTVCSDDVGDDSDEDDLEELHGSQKTGDENGRNSDKTKEKKGQKRKFSDFDGQLNAANKSLRALKKLAGDEMEHASLEATDGILSNEDFQRIKELKAKKEAKLALTQHGLLKKPSDPKSTTFKIPTSDQLSVKRVDAAILEANIRTKMSKEERLALIRAGREDRVKYQARAAVKQKKTGGLSNKQKEHKKAMPLAAKRSKVAKSRQEKRKKKKGAGKQFRGRKAWK